VEVGKQGARVDVSRLVQEVIGTDLVRMEGCQRRAVVERVVGLGMELVLAGSP
jgi:hypothetical protein